MANKDNNPREFMTVISSISETAFQRAIWLQEHSTIGMMKVKWLDIELPVNNSGKARGHCVDLIGFDEKDKRYVLCELKFGKPKGHGSASYAIQEIKQYHEEIKQHYLHLHNHPQSSKEIDWRDVASERTKLIVAANDLYWDYWLKHQSVVFDDQVECYSLSIGKDHFKDQNPNKGKYTPHIEPTQNNWKRIPNTSL